MRQEPQTVESILSALIPAIESPALLKGRTGKIMNPTYRDALLPNGYGFEFEGELEKEIFVALRDDIGNVRAALFALSNAFGVVSGHLSSPIEMGMEFTRAQDETIWHVDRSDREDEYYTLLSPAASTQAKTWVSPVLHFLSVGHNELKTPSSAEVMNAISIDAKTTGTITDRISEIADSINAILNTAPIEHRIELARKIQENSVLVGGKNGWLLFSDPLVIHNGNMPTGEDKHILTFDLARKNGEDFRSVYDTVE